MSNDFIREKIKEKPINKKRVMQKMMISALCGLIFGLVACIVLVTFLSFYKSVNNGAQTQPTETQGSDLNIVGGTEGDSTTQTQDSTELEVPENYTLSIQDYQNLQNSLYAIGNQANKSIVTISTVISDTDWFNVSYESEEQSSGVIIAETTKKILILTEQKIIKDSQKLSVTFIDDTTVEANVLKVDNNTGLAIVTVEKSELSNTTLNRIALATFTDGGYIRNGTIVIALGSPLGTNFSILTGNITSTGNEISTVDANFKVLTTDIVADHQGSGILINTSGQVVGMVMQDYSASQAENTLTAITISDLERIINLLKDGEDIPYLGLKVSTVTQKIMSSYGLPQGAYIRDVALDSPAMEAGLQNGDVVVAVNGKNIVSASEYTDELYSLTPGQSYTIKVMRKGSSSYKLLTYEVIIGTTSK